MTEHQDETTGRRPDLPGPDLRKDQDTAGQGDRPDGQDTDPTATPPTATPPTATPPTVTPPIVTPGRADHDTTTSPEDAGDANGTVRRGSWPLPAPSAGPAEVEVTIDVGRVEVRLADSPGEMSVELRYDPAAGGAWGRGVGGLLGWLSTVTGGGQRGADHGFGPLGADPADLAVTAVQSAEITFSPAGRRLVVSSATEPLLRAVPLAVTVIGPPGTRLALRTGSGEVAVNGRAGWAGVRTGSGDVAVGEVDGDTDVQTGSGRVRLGPVTGRARVRTGSGGIELASTGGPTEVRAGSGPVRVDQVHADLAVRTGSGDVDIADAHQGRLELSTGSGTLHVGVHPGARAQLDLSCGSGRARSELDVTDTAPTGAATLHISGRTGSGDILVRRAALTA